MSPAAAAGELYRSADRLRRSTERAASFARGFVRRRRRACRDAVGSTDELGLYAIEGKAHVNDIHATILHLLGMDHWKMTYFHAGRHERATVNGGEVVKGLLA